MRPPLTRADLLDAAKEVKEKGTFGYLDRTMPTPDLNAFMKE